MQTSNFVATFYLNNSLHVLWYELSLHNLKERFCHFHNVLLDQVQHTASA